MAKIEKLKKGTATIYPATIPQAVVDPTSGKSVRAELDERADHGYSEEEEPKTLKQVETEKSAELDQLADDVNLFKAESNLKDAIQDSKIRDIESIISTMNPNQSAQLSVSGVSPLSLPKNAANGGMQVKLEGLTAENLVVNGDFRNGTTGWTGGNLIIENGRAKITDGNYTCRQSLPNNLISEHKYYFCAVSELKEGISSSTVSSATARVASDGTHKIRLDYAEVDGDGLIREGAFNTPIFNSGIFVADGTEDRIELRWGFYRFSSVEVYYDRIKLIDLTAAFGADNEPTKEQCDLIFSDYFEGVKSFEPTGRVRSVGKNIARVPKNRITFGGLEAYADGNSIVIKGTTGGGGVAIRLTDILKAGLGVGAYDSLFSGNTIGGAGSYVVTISRTGTGGIIHVYKDNAYTQLGNPVTVVSSLSGVGFYAGTFTTVDTRITIQIERGSVATQIEPYRSTSLYLTAPELRSNGMVKDEIRKGANGYELVKRVGVGTSNGEIVEGGDFSDPTKWTVQGGTSIISNGTLKINADAGISSHATQNMTITAGKIYRYKIDVLSLNATAWLIIGDDRARVISSDDSGKTISGFLLSSTGGASIRLTKELSTNVSAEFDNISIIEYNTTEGAAIAGGEVVYGDNIHYTLATPVITPISYGGVLNSAENGTVYHEPIIADAGVYDTKIDILLTDYPINTIEEIIKHENGIDTYLDVASAVVASDGLSFTHPDLTDGDLVLFTYAFDKESTNGNITATFYDSNVVKIDTVTGKAYKIEDVVTNGVLTRTLTEV